jgi:dolichol-phosphate mannosyltransferase
VSIVVPTLREAANLRRIVTRIGEAMRPTAETYEIVVVDDDSRDGSIEIIEELAREGYPVRSIVREDARGLATAVLLGFREARGEILVCLDADGSHPPGLIPRLVAEAGRPDVDIALGSRYVPGGSIDETWSLTRRITSRLAALMARPLTAVHDPMAGFFAIRRDVLARADTLDPVGYKIALELIIKCGCRAVREVPIRFASRSAGRSKLTLAERWRFFRHLLRLAMFKLRGLSRSRTR